MTAGSSGGTAAAVAANFGAIGLGSDTGNSIRGPASHQSLAGIRSTMGLTSRAGVVPLNLLADIAGPMTRTLEDAAVVLQVIAGPDPDDPVTVPGTAAARDFSPGGHPATIPDYRAALRLDGLKGRRIGVLRQAYERDTTDAEIVKVFAAAIEDLKRAGAVIVDPVRVDLDQVRRAQDAGTCGGFKYDINRWLAGHGDRVPVKSLAAIIQSRQFHPTIQRRLEQSQEGTENGPETPACKAESQYRGQVRAAVLQSDDRRDAGRVHLSDVEQPAAAHRRPEHPARRQQPVLLTDDRLSIDQCRDGLHEEQHAARWHHVLRPPLGRAPADLVRLRLRAGHGTPASASARSALTRSSQRPDRRGGDQICLGS